MARSFNGTSDNIRVDGAVVIGGSSFSTFSLAFWVNAATPASQRGIYSEGNSGSAGSNFWWVFANTNGKIHWTINNTSGTNVLTQDSNTSVFDSTWHHCGFTMDASGNWVMYIGGASDKSGAAVNGACTPNRAAIGELVRSGTGNFFSGSIAHLATWTRTLTAGEMASLAAGLPPTHIGALHYWPLWGKDSPEPDLGTGTHTTGTVTGTTVPTTNPPVGPYLIRPVWSTHKQTAVTTNKSDSDTGTLSSSVITAGPATDKSDTDTLFTGDFNSLAPAVSSSDAFTAAAAVSGVALSSTDSGALTSSTAIAQQGTTPSDVEAFTFSETVSVAATLSSTDELFHAEDQGAIRNPNVIQDSDFLTMSEAGTNASGGIGQAIRGVVLAFDDDALTAVPTWTRLDDPKGTS